MSRGTVLTLYLLSAITPLTWGLYMRYLVTGGAGFIGSHLSEALLARGDEVVCVDNFNDYYSPARKRRNVAAALQQRRLYTGRGRFLRPGSN